MKHVNYRGFMRLYAPIIRNAGELGRADYEVVAILREPISWLGSWYRYRQRQGSPNAGEKQRAKSTRDLSFADFLEAYLDESRPAYAKIGNPYRFVCDKNERVGVDRLFRYDDLDRFFHYAAERLEARIEIPKLNVSPSKEYDVPRDLLLRVQEKLAPAFELYESLGADNDLRAKRRANKNEVRTNGARNRKRRGSGKAKPPVLEARPS